MIGNFRFLIIDKHYWRKQGDLVNTSCWILTISMDFLTFLKLLFKVWGMYQKYATMCQVISLLLYYRKRDAWYALILRNVQVAGSVAYDIFDLPLFTKILHIVLALPNIPGGSKYTVSQFKAIMKMWYESLWTFLYWHKGLQKACLLEEREYSNSWYFQRWI